MGNSTKVSSSRWQTPGSMSYSFSGEEILRDELEDDLGSERSVPLNDASSVGICGPWSSVETDVCVADKQVECGNQYRQYPTQQTT